MIKSQSMMLEDKIMKKIGLILFFFVCFFAFPQQVAHANIPDIEGYILVSGTNAPVPNVWVKITNNAAEESNCPQGTINQSRYAKTDSNGKYTFVSWTNGGSSAVGEGKSIDSDLDGKNDVVQYPTFDSCEPGDSPGSIFSCGRDPFAFEVIRPVGWFGTFDSVAKTDARGNCLFCINNGNFTAEAPTLYYHPPKNTSTLTPTNTGGKTPTSTPRVSTSPNASITGTQTVSPTRSTSQTPTISPGSTSCSFTSVPLTKDIRINTPDYLTVGVKQTGGTVDQVTFTSDNGSVVSVCKSPLCAQGTTKYTSNTAQTGLTGFVTGQSTTIHITGKMLASGTTCTPADVLVRVTDSIAWCQFKNTDIVTNGTISCQVPPTCTASAGCSNALITNDTNQSPGVATAQGSVSVGSGIVSKKPPYGWNAQSSYKGILYTYSFFEKKTGGITFNELSFPRINSVLDLTGHPTQEGYYWVRYTGGSSLEIPNGLSIGSNKIVLFVHNADLIIKGKITVTKGKGMFMVVTDNNVLIDSSVGGSGASDIEGIYFTDKQFRTGTSGPGSDSQLRMRGAFVAMDKIVLQRSLSDNSKTPGEFVEYGSDQLMLFPERLGDRNLNWKEIAP
jgi:hypothetical protein